MRCLKCHTKAGGVSFKKKKKGDYNVVKVSVGMKLGGSFVHTRPGFALEVFTHWSKTCCAFVMCFHTEQWNSTVRRCNFIRKWSLVEIIFW